MYDAAEPVNGVEAAIGKVLGGKCMKSICFTSCRAFIDILTHQFSSFRKPQGMLMRLPQRSVIG